MNELALNITHLPYLDSAELFENVADEPWAILLDSGVEFSVVRSTDEGSSSNRYDVLVVGPSSTLVFDGKITTFTMHTGSGRVQNLYGDPMAILQAAIPECERLQSRTYLPGAYGYFSYDLARQYESIPDVANDEEQLPQMAMGIYPTVLVVDHKRKKSRVIRMGDSDHAKAIERRWLDLVLDHQANLVARELEQIEGSDDVTQSNNAATLGGQSLQESLSWPQYQAAFDMIREYTIAGDCYQVNLTKQFTSKVHTDAWQVYKQLRATSPAPYGSYMNLPFAQILSNSPESFIQCRNRKVVTSPIKGTRPRNHSDHEADREIAISLQLSKKDRAENLMIVDLMRNDLSRACELGSVKVPELFALHSFANVHHLISRVEGRLRKELHALDLLRSCFPGGSITGAPKIRAMEIIDELEPNRRGLYCGAIGYVGANGDLETNIAIRTIVIKDGVARFSGGGGLVIDSVVEDEYQELNDKVSMLMAAVMSEKNEAK